MHYREHLISIQETVTYPYVHILFGARQCGKSTLLKNLMPLNTWKIDLLDPAQYREFSTYPENLMAACRAMREEDSPHWIFIDEAQLIPALFNMIQSLYDDNPNKWRFILCGSSARRLRETNINLLPGRSILHHLFPVSLSEQPESGAAPQPHQSIILNRPPPNPSADMPLFPPFSLAERLAYGSLPGIIKAPANLRHKLLDTYVAVHLEQEVRKETQIRDTGKFLNFLRFAAIQSGQQLNHQNIAQETGISNITIKSHFKVLEDMFLGITIPAWSKSPRKNLLSTPKFLMFDLGVRNAAAGLRLTPQTVLADAGNLFEQWVILEINKYLHYNNNGKLWYLRSKDGAEIDCIIETQDEVIPVEIKWTENPSVKDTRHLKTFMEEQPEKCRRAYVVCRCPFPKELAPGIIAVPWQKL